MAADALRVYLTGADADGDPQIDCLDSTGGFRSSSLAESMTVHRYSALRGIRIDYIAPLNGPGLGSLDAATVDQVAWTPPNGTQGDAVSIANGETATLYGGGSDADKYIIVTRTSAYALAGSETVQILDTVNNVIGGENFSAAESTSGASHEMAVMFRAKLAITSGKIWIDPDYADYVQIATESPTSDELLGSGLSYSAPTTEAGGLSIGTLAVDGMLGLHIKHTIAASADAETLIKNVIRFSFVQGGSTYYGSLRGIYHIADSSECYEVYIGEDAVPDVDGSPDDTFSATPHDLDPLASGHVYHIKTIKRNQWGLRSTDAIDAEVVRLDSTNTPPSPPQIVDAYPAADGKVYVSATYFTDAEDDSDYVADTWLIYVSDDGTDPDPSTDTPATESMGSGTVRTLSWTSTTQYLEGQPLKIAVATRRVDDGPVNADSALSDIVTTAAEWFGPRGPRVALSAGSARGLYHAPPSYAGETVYIDEGNNIRWVLTPGQSVLWADAVKVLTIIYDTTGEGNPANGLYLEFGIELNAITGTGTSDPIEVGSWTAGDKHLFVNVRGNRRMKIDVTNQTIECAGIGDLDDMLTTQSDDPAWCRYDATCFQVWNPDPNVADWATAITLDTDGVLNGVVGIR